MKKFFSATLAAIILAVSLFSVNVFAAPATNKTQTLLENLNTAKEVSVTLTAGDVNLFGAFKTQATDTIYIKGNKAAYEYNAGFLKARVILKDGSAYGFLPSFPFVYAKVESALIDIDVWGIIEEATNVTLGVLQYVKSYNESVDGVTYYVEEFNDRAQVTSKFYYTGDDLKMLKVTDAKTGSVQNTYFENISFKVEDSVFEVPASAFDLTPILKWLMLSALPKIVLA